MIEIGGSTIPAHSTQDFVIEVHPLSIGASVTARPGEPLDSSWSRILWTAFVSDENKVTIRLANLTSSPVTPTVRKFIAN